MFKTYSLFSLAILLTISILGPSLLSLIENEANIEIVQDYDKKSKKETKKEIEKSEKYCNGLFDFSLNNDESLDLSSFFYKDKMYGHIPDVHSPPPEHSL